VYFLTLNRAFTSFIYFLLVLRADVVDWSLNLYQATLITSWFSLSSERLSLCSPIFSPWRGKWRAFSSQGNYPVRPCSFMLIWILTTTQAVAREIIGFHCSVNHVSQSKTSSSTSKWNSCNTTSSQSPVCMRACMSVHVCVCVCVGGCVCGGGACIHACV